MASANFCGIYALGRLTPADEMNILALLAGLLSGIIGAMGLGGGAVLIIYLSLFTETEQLKSQGINLLFFIFSATYFIISSLRLRFKSSAFCFTIAILVSSVGG